MLTPINPDGSFPIVREAELEKAKAVIGDKTVIPKGMTAGDYQTMNILPGNRIGWQQKQDHLHRLSDLYTLGYLTEEEYEKRVEWVNNAQTIEQVNIVFADLHRNILTVEAGSYLKPVSAKDYWRVSFGVLIMAAVMVAMYTWLAVIQAWNAELILITGVIVITAAASLYHRK